MGNRRQLIILGALSIVVGLSAVLLRQFPSDSREKGNTLSPPGLSAFDAIQERTHWKKQVASIGAAKTYQELKEAYRASPFDAQHLAVHLFGAVLYETNGNDGLGVCDGAFAFGCYHGFFSSAIGGQGPGVIVPLDRVCRAGGFQAFASACQHGIGHGILEYLGYQKLEDALALCSRVKQENPFYGCTAGVFMEYYMPIIVSAQAARMEFRELDQQNPHDPCPRITNPGWRASCYYSLGQWWDNRLEKDFTEMGRLCAALSARDDQAACFRGVGNVAAPSAGYDAEKTKTNCGAMPTPEGRSACRAEARESFAAGTGKPLLSQ